MWSTNSGIRSVAATDDTGDGISICLYSIHSKFSLTGHDSANKNEGIKANNE